MVHTRSEIFRTSLNWKRSLDVLLLSCHFPQSRVNGPPACEPQRKVEPISFAEKRRYDISMVVDAHAPSLLHYSLGKSSVGGCSTMTACAAFRSAPMCSGHAQYAPIWRVSTILSGPSIQVYGTPNSVGIPSNSIRRSRLNRDPAWQIGVSTRTKFFAHAIVRSWLSLNPHTIN